MGYALACFLSGHARLKAPAGHKQAGLAEEIIASEAAVLTPIPGCRGVQRYAN